MSALFHTFTEHKSQQKQYAYSMRYIVGKNELACWGQDKMAANLQSKFSNAYSWMNIVIFCIRSHWSSFLRVQWSWTHWCWVTHICTSKLTIIGSDNGLSPGRCQATIWTNAGILLIQTLGTNVSEILVKFIYFHGSKCIWICCLRNGGHLVLASMC